MLNVPAGPIFNPCANPTVHFHIYFWSSEHRGSLILTSASKRAHLCFYFKLCHLKKSPSEKGILTITLWGSEHFEILLTALNSFSELKLHPVHLANIYLLIFVPLVAVSSAEFLKRGPPPPWGPRSVSLGFTSRGLHQVDFPWYCITQVSWYIKYSPVKLRRGRRLMKVWKSLV